MFLIDNLKGRGRSLIKRIYNDYYGNGSLYLLPLLLSPVVLRLL